MDSVFFITGSSRGIGKALAEAILAENDQNLVIGLARTKSLDHERFVHVEADLSKDITEKVRSLFEQYQPAKSVVLINNAGTLGHTAYFGRIDSQQLVKAFQVNVAAPAVLMNEFIRAYGNSNAAPLILNISSGAGKSPVDGWAGYCASKAALDMLSEVASLESRKRGGALKVFSVSPGVVDTEMQSEIRGTDQKDFSRVQQFVQLKKEGELSSPEKVAQKIMNLIQNPGRFDSVLQDVRRF